MENEEKKKLEEQVKQEKEINREVLEKMTEQEAELLELQKPKGEQCIGSMI